MDERVKRKLNILLALLFLILLIGGFYLITRTITQVTGYTVKNITEEIAKNISGNISG